MRSVTAGETTTLGLASKRITLRVKVANGDGTMIDYSDWVESLTIEQDVDQPVSGATVSFTRAGSSTQSLSPLRTDSTLNRLNDLVTYSPAIDLNRSITIEVATTVIGDAILAADYKLLFKGTVDVVNFERSPVSIECRDLGAPLVDRWIETETNFGSSGGTAIQTVMQNILDHVFGAGVYTLYVPVSPGFNIVTYRQQKMSVMDALQDLAQLIGWDVRYKWDNGTSTFRLTLSEPPRSKTVPDWTFYSGMYFDVTRLNLELTNIRNVVTVSFRDSADLGNRNTVTVSDAPSITKYGRRFFYIQEADVSPIDTAAEATTMANAALADLKDPKADQEVDMPFWWPADLGDLYRYPDNDVHYDTNQDIAVAEIKHEFAPNHHRTKVRVRGSPIGQYMTWLGRGTTGPTGGGGPGGAAFAPRPSIVPLNTEADNTVWNLRFSAVYGSGGGGANLTYTIKTKTAFGAEVTVTSGTAADFPKDQGITRGLKEDKLVTFTVSDAATGMSAAAQMTVPAYRIVISDDGTHLLGGGGTPTLSDISAFWNGTNSITGRDSAGRITLNKTTTASSSASPQCKVTFTTAYASAPFVALTANSTDPTPEQMGGYGFVSQIVASTVTTTHFIVTFRARLPGVGVTTAETVTIDYVVVGGG